MRERRKKGNPLSRTVVITSVRPGFEKVVLGTTNVCTVLLAEKSQLSICQASREQIIIKGALFPQGEGRERGKKKIRDPNGIQCRPGKAASHLLTSSHMALHSLPTSEIPRDYS